MRYNFLVIEGNIGSGKTNLAKKIAEDFNGKSNSGGICRQSIPTKIL